MSGPRLARSRASRRPPLDRGKATNKLVACHRSKDEKAVVEILEPPADAEDGEPALVAGFEGAPATANQVKKKKLWAPVAEELKLVGGVAKFGADDITVDGAPLSCPSIPDGNIS